MSSRLVANLDLVRPMVWPLSGAGLPPPPELWLDEAQEARKQKEPRESEEAPAAPVSPQVDIEALLANAEAETRRRIEGARSAAFEEGRHRGIAEGEERALRQLDPVLARLARSIEDLALVRRRLHVEAEHDVVKLAVAIGRRILNRELSVDPEAILGLVHSGLAKLDSRELHTVCVHPADAQRVREELERLALPKRVDVTADPALERGAILFETARGVLDASVNAQFEEIERGLADALGRRSER